MREPQLDCHQKSVPVARQYTDILEEKQTTPPLVIMSLFLLRISASREKMCRAANTM